MEKPVIVSVVAQKGGVGKSTTALGLGRTAAEQGIKTVLIDFDSQGSLSTSVLDMGNIPKGKDAYTFVKTHDSYEPIKVADNLFVIPASLDLLKFDEESFESFFLLGERIESELKNYDLVIIDTAGTLRTTVTAALTASHFMYSPIELNSYSLKAYDDVAKLFKNVRRRLNSKIDFIGFLPNRVHSCREIEGQRVPFQLDEREVYRQLLEMPLGRDNILYLVEELAGIRRSVQAGNAGAAKDVEQATKQVKDFSQTILSRIGL